MSEFVVFPAGFLREGEALEVRASYRLSPDSDPVAVLVEMAREIDKGPRPNLMQIHPKCEGGMWRMAARAIGDGIVRWAFVRAVGGRA